MPALEVGVGLGRPVLGGPLGRRCSPPAPHLASTSHGPAVGPSDTRHFLRRFLAAQRAAPAVLGAGGGGRRASVSEQESPPILTTHPQALHSSPGQQAPLGAQRRGPP